MGHFVKITGLLCLLVVLGEARRRRSSSTVNVQITPPVWSDEENDQAIIKCSGNHTFWRRNGIRILDGSRVPGANFTIKSEQGGTKLEILVDRNTENNRQIYGRYSCMGWTDHGTDTKSVWLKPRNTPNYHQCDLAFAAKPENRLAEIGEFVELECFPRNIDDTATVTWFTSSAGGVPTEITGSSHNDIIPVNSGLLILAAKLEHTANYTCEVSKGPHCTRNATAEVVVYSHIMDACGRTPANTSKKLNDILQSQAGYHLRSRVANHGLIRSGDIAHNGSFPWQVLLQNENGQFCAGSVLSRYYVITAAHCVANMAEDKFFLRFGRNEKNPIHYERYEQVRYVDRIFIHPYCNKSRQFNYDQAIIRLKTPLRFTDYVRPICLPLLNTVMFRNSFKPGVKALIIGWANEEHLQEADVLIKAREDCDSTITDNMFCTGPAENDQVTACQGDSGGPVAVPIKVAEDPVVWYLGGIISWGRECIGTEVNKFNYHSNVSATIDWIVHTVQYVLL